MFVREDTTPCWERLAKMSGAPFYREARHTEHRGLIFGRCNAIL